MKDDERESYAAFLKRTMAPKRLLKLCGIYFAVAIIILTYFLLYGEELFFRTSIPEKIQTSHVLKISGDSGCGVAAFRIKNDVLVAIQSQGLPFFADAQTSSRKNLLSKKRAPITYDPWRETPMPAEALTNGLPGAGWGCAVEPEKGWFLKVLTALREPGSYYSYQSTGESTHKGNVILVLPKQKAVVMTFFD